jgi:hypothetical protein
MIKTNHAGEFKIQIMLFCGVNIQLIQLIVWVCFEHRDAAIAWVAITLVAPTQPDGADQFSVLSFYSPEN